MTSPPDRHRATGSFLQFAGLVVVVFGLQATRAWLMPICFALLIAVLAEVPLRWLQRRGLPRPIAAVVALAAVCLVSWFLVRNLVLALTDFGASLPRYEGRLQGLVTDVTAWLGGIGLHVEPGALVASIEPRAWLGFLQQSVGGAFGFFSALFLVGFAVVFTLWEGERLRNRLQTSFGPAWDQPRLAAMVADLQRYLGVKTVTSALTGASVYLLNLLFGVEFAVLWGLLAFVLNFIPIIGSIIAALPALLLAVVMPELGMGVALTLAIAYVLVNCAISDLLEPVLMGRQFGLPAFVVLLSLVFWGWVWGAGGMFLAVPLTIVVGTLVADRRDLALLRALVGREPREG